MKNRQRVLTVSAKQRAKIIAAAADLAHTSAAVVAEARRLSLHFSWDPDAKFYIYTGPADAVERFRDSLEAWDCTSKELARARDDAAQTVVDKNRRRLGSGPG